MSTTLMPPSTPTRPKQFGSLGWVSVLVFISCLFILFMRYAESARGVGGGMGQSVESPASVVPACMSYEDFLDVEPGKVVPITVYVIADACGSNAETAAEKSVWQSDHSAAAALAAAFQKGSITEAEYKTRLAQLTDAEPGKTDAARLKSRQDVTIGSKVKVELKAPLFDGTLAAVADDTETFDANHANGRWEWQLKPNTPGDFELPLRMTIYDSSGKEALAEDEIMNVHVHVPVTTGYVASSIWTTIAGFFSSFQGLVASIGGIAAGTAGFRAWVARKSKKAVNNLEPAFADGAGYL